LALKLFISAARVQKEEQEQEQEQEQEWGLQCYVISNVIWI
jgi:hypothetical protein